MKKFIVLLVGAVLLCGACGESAWAAQTLKQYKKNLAYNKNALPAGWQYETGYTLWRMNRGLPVNRVTYKKYVKDRNWHNNMNRNYRAEDIVIDSLDWTAEETALFWQNYKEFFQFHPSGIVE
jgi:hypothetical protein